MQNFMKRAADQKGFTLVELMIVVAIIGILAAIAIPQFAAYRIRGFNSSALSDTKNLQTSEAAFFADHQLYAVTGTVTALATPTTAGTTDMLAGPQTIANSIISQWVGGAQRSVGISIGNGVTVMAKNNAAATAYNAGAKHLQGDTIYGVDSDSTLTYGNATGAAGTALAAANVIAAVINTDEYAAAGAPWVAK